MKIVTLATRLDRGGASRVALTLHRAFRAAGADAVFVAGASDLPTSEGEHLVLGSSGRLVFRLLRSLDQRRWQALGVAGGAQFSSGILGLSERWVLARHRPDVVHFHHAMPGLVRSLGCMPWSHRRFWTLHDSWIFTGGCHVPGSCRGYLAGCPDCPLVSGRLGKGLVRWGTRRKRQMLSDDAFHLIAPSTAVAEMARETGWASPERLSMIPNPVDVTRFTPLDKRAAREALGLPSDLPLILTGANFIDLPNKGFGDLGLLMEAMARVANVRWAVFGRTSGDPRRLLPPSAAWLGHTTDDAVLAQWYSAADVFVSLSRSETFGLAVAEAMACGTPAVAWKVGGLGDVIDDGSNGFLMPPGDVDALARGVATAMGNPGLGRAARTKVATAFDAARVAERHLALYARAREPCSC